jgi:hypothetical protein
MRCCGYYARVLPGVIYLLIMGIGKIPIGVSAVGEIKAYGKRFLMW